MRFVSIAAVCAIPSAAWAYPDAFCGRGVDGEGCPQFAQSWFAIAVIGASAAFVAVEITRRIRLAALPILAIVPLFWRSAVVARLRSWPFEPSELVATAAMLTVVVAVTSYLAFNWQRQRNFERSCRLDRRTTGEVTADEAAYVVHDADGTSLWLDRRSTRALGFARRAPPSGRCTVLFHDGLPNVAPFRGGSARAMVRGAWLIDGDTTVARDVLVDATNRALRLAVAAAIFSLHVAWIVWLGSMNV